MDNSTIALTVISVLGTLSSIIFGFMAFKRNEKNDTKANGINQGIILTEIEYIKDSINRIENSLTILESKYDEISKRLIKFEDSTSNAHNKIYALNEKLKGEITYEWNFN